MQALLTGATGFLGTHIARRWVAAGHELRVIYRSERKLAHLGDLPYEAVQADLEDKAALRAACRGCQVVFHTAAKVDYWRDEDESALWRVNVEGARNVFAAAQAAGVERVIFTSSAASIGIVPGRACADETTSLRLPRKRFPYAWSKLEAEAVAAEFVQRGLNIVTLNPAAIIGPGDMNAISGSFVLETARWQWLVPLSSGGLSVIDVRDVAQAHVNAIERGHIGGRTILTAANLPYRDWFHMIAATCGVRPPRFTSPDALLEPIARAIELLRRLGLQTPMDANQVRLGGQHIYFDASKARRSVGAPKIAIEDSLRDTYDWYARRGLIKRDALARLIARF